VVVTITYTVKILVIVISQVLEVASTLVVSVACLSPVQGTTHDRSICVSRPCLVPVLSGPHSNVEDCLHDRQMKSLSLLPVFPPDFAISATRRAPTQLEGWYHGAQLRTVMGE